MSYDFSGLGHFNGVAAGAYSLPLTIGCFAKFKTVHTISDIAVNFGTSAASLNESVWLGTGGTDDNYRCFSRDTVGQTGAFFTSGAAEFDDVWFGWVGSIISATSRKVYVDVIGNTGSNGTSRVVGSAIDDIAIGERVDGSQNFPHFIAEVFFYNGTMSDADITSYLGGLKATELVGAANLIGYYSLDSDNDSPPNESSGDAPTLALTGSASFDADHPIITGGEVVTLMGAGIL